MHFHFYLFSNSNRHTARAQRTHTFSTHSLLAAGQSKRCIFHDFQLKMLMNILRMHEVATSCASAAAFSNNNNGTKRTKRLSPTCKLRMHRCIYAVATWPLFSHHLPLDIMCEVCECVRLPQFLITRALSPLFSAFRTQTQARIECACNQIYA